MTLGPTEQGTSAWAPARPAGPSRPERTPTGIAPVAAAENPRLLTADEVAGILRTSRDVVYEMNRKHRIPGALRIGRRLLFRRDRLLEWLRESSVSSL